MFTLLTVVALVFHGGFGNPETPVNDEWNSVYYDDEYGYVLI